MVRVVFCLLTFSTICFARDLGVKDDQDHGLHAGVKYKNGMEDILDTDYPGPRTHGRPPPSHPLNYQPHVLKDSLNIDYLDPRTHDRPPSSHPLNYQARILENGLDTDYAGPRTHDRPPPSHPLNYKERVWEHNVNID
ncbi:hypothetical protein OIU85_014599 [Salix viminalis]|uniref:Uncharacterized protein n=1 Tax=Salix viminalis TaxID=40686 RepID=A0A9Q0NJE9_SALVM|nr:hypothetical protein OIU85_014599 [Salix viminalis]